MRIAIAHHSNVALDALRTAVASDPKHRLVWTAATSDEALQRCGEHATDVLLLEVALPSAGGVAVTRQLMRTAPCAILLVVDSLHTDGSRVFEAMGEGALDVVELPKASAGSLQGLLRKKLDTIKRLLGDSSRLSVAMPSALGQEEGLLAIGASAGGPAALARLLRALPATFPFAIVLVQHVDPQFAAGMADWLCSESAWQVRIARDGDRPTAGTALLASAPDHLVLKSADRLGYTSEPSDYPYRPSIDAFFQSVSRLWQGEALGVLLTGMGRDGAVGLKALRDKGHHTIAQDEHSSAVYGMPKAAVRLGAAVDVLPLDDIAPRLERLARLGRGTTKGRL